MSRTAIRHAAPQHHLSQHALNGTPYMSQSNAVGQGFDVYGKLDMSGLITPLFDITKAPTQIFTFLGQDYLIPTFITPVEDTRGYYNGGTYESRDSFQSSVAAHAGVEIGYGAFSGEMKADYSGEFSQNTRYAYAYNNFYAPLAYLQLNGEAAQYVSAAFASALANLPATFTPDNAGLFTAFFQQYGGYYTARVTIGGSFAFYVSVAQSSGLSEQSINVVFNAQYNGLVNSGSIDASVKGSAMWQSYTQASETHIFVSGGDPTKIAVLEAVQNDPLDPSADTVARYAAWANTIAANPAIVDFTLKGIWELCGPKREAVRQAWHDYSQHQRPRLTLSTQSETMNWYNNSQLPDALPPIITLAGSLLKPEQSPTTATGYQLVVLQNDGSDVTDPGAVLFNQYYSLPLEMDWWDTYPAMYQQLADDLSAFAGSGSIMILASFGMSANMPPTTDAYTQLVTCGAGDQLTYWENNCDPGSGAWVQYPVDYILVSAFDSGPNQGIEVYSRVPWPVNQVSDQLEVFLYKQSNDEPYTLGM